LLDDGVARTGQDFDEGGFVEVVEDADDGQAADEFGDQTEADQVLRFGLAQQLGVTLAGFSKLFFLLLAGAEAHGLLADAPGHDFFQSREGAPADEEDGGGVDRGEFLMRMLAPALGRNVGDGAFQDLEQRLLHAFAADVAGDGGVLVLAADFVDLIYIDDAGLGAAYVAVGCLEQLEHDVFDVLADVAGFSERGGVDNGEGNVEHAGQRLGQQRLAGTGGPDQHDVGLGKLHVAGLGAVHVDALVVVVNSYGKLFLGLL